MARNRFYDPSDGTEYLWKINHFEEDEAGEGTNVERTARTSGIGVVRQQGDEEPMRLTLHGTILEREQHLAFTAWRRKCRNRTIRFMDYAGDEYEVLITAYRPRRQWVARNPKGGTDAPHHVWRYTIEMDVIQVLAGSWA